MGFKMIPIFFRMTSTLGVIGGYPYPFLIDISLVTSFKVYIPLLVHQYEIKGPWLINNAVDP